MTSESRGSAERGHLEPAATDGPSRRRLLTLAGGSALVAGAALGPFSQFFTAGAADAEVAPEIQLSTFLVGIELAAADLYDKASKTSSLDAATRQLARTCADHHKAQGSALGSMITAAGGTVPTDPNAKFLASYQPRVSQAGGASALGAVFTGMEDGFAATYLSALSTISSAPIAAIAAQVLATDAGQATAWSAVANGQGTDVPLPASAQTPQFQTTDGAFAATEFETPTTTEAQS